MQCSDQAVTNLKFRNLFLIFFKHMEMMDNTWLDMDVTQKSAQPHFTATIIKNSHYWQSIDLSHMCKGSRPVRKVQFFFNIVQKAFDPPPFRLNIMWWIFKKRFWALNDTCCINVGFREAPCKKSFGILASYWTPPKIK